MVGTKTDDPLQDEALIEETEEVVIDEPLIEDLTAGIPKIEDIIKDIPKLEDLVLPAYEPIDLTAYDPSAPPPPPRQPNATVRDVATWMKQEADKQSYTYQEQIVYELKREFGDKFTHENENGNPAINTDVLKEFKKITPDYVWNRSERYWRKRTGNDDPNKREVYD